MASTGLTDYLDWPGVAPVFRLHRRWVEKGVTKQDLHYGITSLSGQVGPPGRLLDLKRAQWSIENRLHPVKDVSLGEDQSLIPQGQGPTVMALLRDVAVSLLRQAGIRQISARLRYHSQHPAAAVALLIAAPSTRAEALRRAAAKPLATRPHQYHVIAGWPPRAPDAVRYAQGSTHSATRRPQDTCYVSL